MGNERAYDRVSWAEGSVRTCWEARGYQSPGGASAQRDGCSYRLQSQRVGGEPLGSICPLSEAASLYVEAGAVQFACRQMDLGAGRIICSRPRGAVQGLDQDRPRPAEEWRNPVDLPEWDAERSEYFRLSAVPPRSRFTPAFHLFLPSIKVLMTCGSRTSCSVRGSG